MGCGSSTVKDNIQKVKNKIQQAQRKIMPKKKDNQVKKEDEEDLHKAKNLIGGESIKVEQKFVKVKKHDAKDIKTQLVSEKTFDKFSTTKKSLNGQPFTDSEFPPEFKSLTLVSDEMPEAGEYEWKRAQELFEGKNISLFQGKIEPNDIEQGNLGDCYFLSALSVLAERENLIQKLFIDKNVNKEGIYGTLICIDGEFKEVLVDDYIPSKDGRCVFSRSNEKDLEKYGGELWVMILEKVYAKCFGAYNQIVSGHAGNAIRDLTGAPAFDMSCSEGADKMWDFIFEHERLGHMLTAGSEGQLVDGKEVDRGDGIVSGHAYAILDAQDVYGNGQDRIIKMRNPWGNKEWEGDWSDKSSKWTEELKRKFDFKNEDDGVFWIEIKDFITQFSDVTANFVNDQYLYSSYKINMDTKNHMALIKFNVQNDDTHAFIQITQKDRRHFLKSDNYEYSLASVLICKGNFQEWVGCKTSKGRNITVEGEFQKGTYIAFVNIEWSENKCDADFFTISAYASSQIMFHQDSELYNDESEIPVLDKMLICQPPENQEKVRRYDDDQDVIRYQGEAGGYLYFQFVNQSKQKSILYEKIQLPSYEHLQIMPPFTNSSEFEITVNPGEAKVVKYKTLPEGNGAYSYSVMYGGYIELSNEVFREKLLENAKQKREEREDWKVYSSSMQISGGYAFFYQNESNGTYIENLEFDLNNLQVVHEDGSVGENKLDIKIGPGETYMFKLKVINATQGYSYGSSYGYQLE